MKSFLGRHRLIWVVPLLIWSLYGAYAYWLASVESDTPSSAFIYDL
ncbi:MAG: hypothetical protein AAF957_29335 [Planctomycetota bacterium]